MIQCAMCGRDAAADEIVECRYCDAVCCSDACLDEHETQAHGDEAVIALDDEEL